MFFVNTRLKQKSRLHGGFTTPCDQGQHKNQAGHYNVYKVMARNNI